MINDKYRLLTGQGFDAQWQSAVNNNDDVFVISVIGNSRVGKSLIAKAFSLENENSPTAAPPEVDDLLVSTTGNIGCYESRNMSEGTSKTLVLDYEGEDSGLPLMLRLRRHMHGSDKQNERRKFVKESFSKLAYILGNIVILVGKDELNNFSYVERCSKFAKRAAAGVKDCEHLPVLIIIQNMSMSQTKCNSDLLIARFLECHGNSMNMMELYTYFSDIFCFRLPITSNQTWDKVTGKFGSQIFQDNIDLLKTKIKEIYHQHVQQQRLITHMQWLFMMDSVLETVSDGGTVSLVILLA
ncbi:unnamed protein product [Didymodactylos carnosus]|uniref:Uncharacterized protein n=1 Tax=Didymodactylos carnosus TaxID=1234261 RepID=A0A8S2GQM7_9BILA|nr:unnamed protein product [Didymodactylos carnosus]CAF3551434.1 unnamed protein product [Didymodactylos carnosus]